MKLWPNLGGEEGRLSPALKPEHGLRNIARAWALLFGSDAVLLSREPEGEEPRAWPAAFGADAPRACWDWLGRGAGAVAWWPDSGARAELERRGLRLEAPRDSTLRAVHDKAFTLVHAREHGGLGGELGDCVAVFDPDELSDASAIEAVLAGWPDWARRHWALKPRFGSTGRGRVHSTELVDAERFARALPRLARRGGAILEPWLDRVQDSSVQLVVHADGSVENLGSLHQLVNAGGAVLGGAATFDEKRRSIGAGEHHETLVTDAIALARAASARGFRGPCGVDSFTWRDPSGQVRLRSLCELNARFTTGHVAIGCALRALEAGRLAPAQSWRFLLAGGEGLSLTGETGPSLSRGSRS